MHVCMLSETWALLLKEGQSGRMYACVCRIWTCTSIRAYIHTYIHTCLHSYLHTCIHTYRHTYVHTCPHIYTCIHTYIHTYMCSMWRQGPNCACIWLRKGSAHHGGPWPLRMYHCLEIQPWRQAIGMYVLRVCVCVWSYNWGPRSGCITALKFNPDDKQLECMCCVCVFCTCVCVCACVYSYHRGSLPLRMYHCIEIQPWRQTIGMYVLCVCVLHLCVCVCFAPVCVCVRGYIVTSLYEGPCHSGCITALKFRSWWRVCIYTY